MYTKIHTYVHAYMYKLYIPRLAGSERAEAQLTYATRAEAYMRERGSSRLAGSERAEAELIDRYICESRGCSSRGSRSLLLDP